MTTDSVDLLWPNNVSRIWYNDSHCEWLWDMLSTYRDTERHYWSIHEQRYAERQVYGRNLE